MSNFILVKFVRQQTHAGCTSWLQNGYLLDLNAIKSFLNHKCVFKILQIKARSLLVVPISSPKSISFSPWRHHPQLAVFISPAVPKLVWYASTFALFESESILSEVLSSERGRFTAYSSHRGWFQPGLPPSGNLFIAPEWQPASLAALLWGQRLTRLMLDYCYLFEMWKRKVFRKVTLNDRRVQNERRRKEKEMWW